MDLERDQNALQSFHDDPAYAKVLAGLKKRYHDLREHSDGNSETIPATRGDEDRWRDRKHEKNKQAAEQEVELAFIGDSITQGWEGNGKQVWEKFYANRKPINFGFGGDRTEHVIWRLTHGHLNKIRPKVAVLMIGTNNTGHLMQEPAEVAAGIKKIVGILQQRSPDTKLLLLGVFPRGKSPYDLDRLNNVAINQIIRKLDDGNQVHYMDIGEVFIDKEGRLPDSIMPDALHLNEAGYELWANAIEGKLAELLGEETE